MKCIDHKVIDESQGVLSVQTEAGVFAIRVFRTSATDILMFSFRHPDPDQTVRARPVLDRLNRIIPFDVYDLMIAT